MFSKILGFVVCTIFAIGCLAILIYEPTPWLRVTEAPTPLLKNSAIEKAKRLSYAAKELNLFSCFSIPEKTCDNFFDRLYSSAQTKTALMKALGHARRKEVFVFATNRFGIGSGYLFINAAATDENIINFLLENAEIR